MFYAGRIYQALALGWHTTPLIGDGPGHVTRFFMTRTALHARFLIVIPSATMRVQNYAGSDIRHGSWLKVLRRLSRDLIRFWKITDNISLTVQDRDMDAVEH